MGRADQDWKAAELEDERTARYYSETLKKKKKSLEVKTIQIDELKTRPVKITCLHQNEFFLLNEELHMVVSRQRHTLTFNFNTAEVEAFLPTQLVEKIETEIELEIKSFVIKAKNS